MAKKSVNFRFDESTINEINELCSIYKFDMTKLMTTLVHGEYLKVSEHGKKEIENLMSQLNEITNAFESLAIKTNGKK